MSNNNIGVAVVTSAGYELVNCQCKAQAHHEPITAAAVEPNMYDRQPSYLTAPLSTNMSSPAEVSDREADLLECQSRLLCQEKKPDVAIFV
jgi:hypothetical protein